MSEVGCALEDIITATTLGGQQLVGGGHETPMPPRPRIVARLQNLLAAGDRRPGNCHTRTTEGP
jgi:hypothetical protein